MQLLLVVLLFLSAAYAEHDISAAHVRQFQDYMRQYRKPYLNYATSHPLYQKRFQAFRTSLHRIEKHNAQFDQGIYTFTLGLNDIADLTDEEYKQLLGYRKKQATKETIGVSKTFSLDSNFDKASLPDSWDWREYDAVNPVKNQGQCGSCWAFSAVASMECVYANTTGKLVSFSEQELVDCCDNGQDTCNRGGEMQHGFTEIIKHHGGKIDPEDVYKYTATSKGVCKAKDDKALGHFTSFVDVKSGDEEAVRAAVATKAVLSIAIDASPFVFQLYHHGVFNWPHCKNGPDELDHGVALVGYGVYKKKDFWLVRNSWGSTWGMEGYIMMSRNKKNQCGVATDASYPIMTKQDKEVQSKEKTEEEKQLAFDLKEFEKYMTAYKKEYQGLSASHSLYQKRFKAFRKNLRRIKTHNEQYKNGVFTFTLALNDIADLTDEEYKQLLGYRKKQATKETVDASKTFSLDSNFDKASLPDSWDWREYDAVNPVKNQGQCGSCWAFSAVASMECVYANTTGKLVSFSEQELVDCCDNGQDTCNRGGEMQHGFTEIIKHHGGKIDPEDVYKYTATSKGVCRAKDDKALGHFTSFVNVKSGDEEAVRAAVATKAVLSIAIDASPFAFQLYHHGVFNWPLCKNKSDELDHGVALVGYGVYKKKDFWLVRNSWGSTWGMEGYIMMSRNKKNQCGVATDASYPIMAKEEIQSITAIM